MSDDSTKKSSSLSTPQATANLDDVLASLEQQTGQSVPNSTQPTVMPVQPIEPSPAPVEIAPTTTVIQEPVLQTPQNPSEKQFAVEEKHIEPKENIVSPVIEPLESTTSVQDHPQVNIETPVIPTLHEEVTTSAPISPVPAKRGLFGSFFNPKFAVGAAIVAIMAIGGVAAYISSQGPTGSLDTREKAATADCKIEYIGTTSFKVTNCAGKKIARYTGPSCPTTQTKTGEETVGDETTHEYLPNPQPGQCEQVDHMFDGIGTNGTQGGVCACAPAAKKSCGESCATDSDCRNPSAAGIPVVCRAGKCENSACPAGQTQPGANCSCNAGRSCGQSCGASVGLCTDGKSTCGFATATNQCLASEGDVTKQFCIPLKPNNGYTTAACSGIFTVALVKPNGQPALTQADVQAACAPPAPTPTPTPAPKCGSTCTTNASCPTGMACTAGVCRNPSCTSSTTCVCPTPTPPPTNVCVISDIAVLPYPVATDWNTTGMFELKNKATHPTTINVRLDNWTDNSLDKDQTITLQAGESRQFGLGKICSKWQIDIGCPPKYDDWGSVVEPNPSACVTPTPTTPPMACMKIVKDVATPVIGSQVRFTCGLVSGATKYEFRYKYSFNGGQDVGGTIQANGNVSVPLVISQPATYKVQCRPCIGQACSQWEAW